MNTLSKCGFGLAMLAMLYLAGLLISTGAPLNPATWGLWFVIDFAVMISLARAKRPYSIMVAFTVGTALILAITLYHLVMGTSSFVWGHGETVSVVAVAIALLVWSRTTDDVGAVATVVAMIIAGIPTWVDTFRVPQSQSVLFWSMSGLACLLSTLGSPKTFMDRFMPASGIGANGIILLLAMRQYS